MGWKLFHLLYELHQRANMAGQLVRFEVCFTFFSTLNYYHSFFFLVLLLLYYHYIAAGRLANGPIFICFLSLAVSRGRSTFSACYLRIRVTKVLFYHRKNVKSYFQLIMQKYWVLQHAPAVLLCPFHQLWLGPLLRVLQSPSVSNLF